MPITVRVSGIFLGDPLNETFEVPFRHKDTPKRLDKKRALGRRFFHGALRSGRASFLLNGDRLEIPDALDQPLEEGDEISVLSAIAGGCSR